MPVEFVQTNRRGQLYDTLNELGSYEVVVGFENRKHENSDLTVAQIAYIQEFGSPARNIPPRPFFFPGLELAKPEIKKLMKKYGKLAAQGRRGSIQFGLASVGQEAVNSIRRKLLSGPFAPLKPETVKRKGHDVPLIDTGQMLESIAYRIRRRT